MHLIFILLIGLFQRAIMQSGSANCIWTYTDSPKTNAFEVARQLNCSSEEETLSSSQLVECLQNKPARSIVSAAQYFQVCITCYFIVKKLCSRWMSRKLVHELIFEMNKFQTFVSFPGGSAPFGDGKYLKAHPDELIAQGKFHDVDLMAGFTSDEGTIATMSEKQYDLYWEYQPTICQFNHKVAHQH